MTARRRILWVSSLAPWLVAALVWGVVQLAQPGGQPGRPEPVGGAAAPGDSVDSQATPARQVAAGAPDWTAILARLDRRRALAYAAGDPARLRSVYVPGSTVLRHDVAMLRAYQRREVRLTGVRLRLLDVAMLRRSDAYARLRVVDRLDRPTAHTAKGSVRLPRDRATERVIVLRDAGEGWRIAAVRPV
jgi:hypothetical protein